MTARLATICASLFFCVSVEAGADDPPVEPLAPLKSVEAEPEAKKDGAFKPPPGFRTKKSGDGVVYCRKETPLGSRFSTVKCYDEAGIRQLQLQELENTERVERMRACKIGTCTI